MTDGTAKHRGPRLLRTTVFQLSLLYAVGFSLLTALILGAIYWSTTRYITTQVDAGLTLERDQLIATLHDEGIDDLRALVDQRAQAGLDRGRYYLLIGAGEQVLAGNLSNWPAAVSRSPGPAVFNDDSLSIPASARADDDDTDVRTVVAQLPDGGFLLVGQALSEEESLAEHTGWLLAWAVGLITLLALLGGIWMGRSVLHRIDGVSNTAGEIMAGRLSRRMPVGRRGDEFDELSERLNAMLGRIDELVRGMREVTDNVAHDLRSPLNRLRNRLEITLLESRPQAEYQEVIAQTITDLDEVLNTFNTLLSIAQAEAGVKRQHFAAVDLTALCT
ncbi:MAG: HAMP domain-containing protein, partial [Gammaproteobacteria bacterium]